MSASGRPPAATGAAGEAGLWSELAGWVPAGWHDVEPTEAAVVVLFDPAADLTRRSSAWGHRLPDASVSSLASFGAGLAMAEADAWEQDAPHVATRAYAERRFLLGDRLLHWAVPWLDAVGRCYPEHRGDAHRCRDLLLVLGDRLRPAPDLGAVEGMTPPGEDSFGPVAQTASLERWLRSVWSGVVVLDATVRSMTGGRAELDLAGPGRTDAAMLFTVAAARWSGLAASHPGSARLWCDLSARAATTARLLAAGDAPPR